MKRSHEYDSPVLSRIVSVVTIFAICICSVCACLTTYKMSQLTSGTVAVQPAQSSDSGNQGSSATPAPTTQAAPADNGGSTETPAANDDGGSTEAPADSGAETDPATVLAKYTEVMDKLKTCKTYDKKEFQQLPEDKRDLGTIGNIIMPIAEGFMTSEDKAEDQHRDDPHNQIPVINNNKGCLLTDASAIKSCSMKDEGGKTTIVLTLNNEKNCQPCEPDAATAPSNVGAVFNPMSEADINEKLASISAVKVNSFELEYQDCTATLVFNTETLEVESLEQIMNCYITANVKALIVTIDGYATLVNTMRIWNVVY